MFVKFIGCVLGISIFSRGRERTSDKGGDCEVHEKSWNLANLENAKHKKQRPAWTTLTKTRNASALHCPCRLHACWARLRVLRDSGLSKAAGICLNALFPVWTGNEVIFMGQTGSSSDCETEPCRSWPPISQFLWRVRNCLSITHNHNKLHTARKQLTSSAS